MPRPFRPILFLTLVTLGCLGVATYLWRPLLGTHVLGPPHPGPAALPAATEKVYSSPTPTLDFNNLPLTDAFDHLRDITKRNIFVNWRALEAAGIPKTHPVILHLPPGRLDRALRQLIEHVQSTRPGIRLAFTEDEGVLTLSTREDLALNTNTRVYDVRDLVQLAPGFASAATTVPASPPIAIAPQPANPGAPERKVNLAPLPIRQSRTYFRHRLDTFLVPGPRNTPSRTAALTADIRQAVDPTSWRESGGRSGSIRVLNGQLIVQATPENQVDVAHYLERRRWQMGLAAFAARTLALLLAALALVALAFPIARLFRRRHTAGLCPACGYDLRATPERCPECGHSPEGVPA